MTQPSTITFLPNKFDQMASFEGRIVIFIPESADLKPAADHANHLTQGAVARFVTTTTFQKMTFGDVFSLNFPAGLAADALDIVKLPRRPNSTQARKAGVAMAKIRSDKALLVMLEDNTETVNLALGIILRGYVFNDHKSAPDAATQVAETHLMVSAPAEFEEQFSAIRAVAEGVFFTRDLVSEPANVLTTKEFADRLASLTAVGLEVEVLEEDRLAALDMGSLLCVGQGSASPSKVVVMQWKGGAKGAAPLALVGKGVVFDSGGISLKPAGGMEDMAMDMGGAAVVAGLMKTIAMRKAKANVVGLVGLVENMPSGTATRPGDVVRSMKGDTIEVINTDAEGRLVLADLLWYAQERFAPSRMINLATLTGAAIIALGHENAAVFSNNDTFCNDFLRAAGAEGEGAWRMPLGVGYDALIKSQIADMKNTGGRPAGCITAAQFLQRFVKPKTPWIHLDIAGVTHIKSASTYSPKGATGWGVMSLNRLIADSFEV
ncbi:MAG: leucyl aminopeptidase [Paracoccaceae bacterium]|nr:leucyl aminopeptidase [Paracoccaceae bacterium]